MPAPVRDAVTAVLVHGDALYITRRPPQMPAFPGYWAFPGGKVDKTDPDEPYSSSFLSAHPSRVMRALVRELAEETGLDLEASIASGLVTRIACLGEATTPEFVPLRFRTWFFRIDFRERPALTPDPRETDRADWITVQQLHDSYQQGRLLVVPPTRLVIERLSADINADSVPELALDYDPETQIPALEPLAGLRTLIVHSNTLPPADRTSAFLIGDKGAKQVLVDPSPCDREEMKRLCDTLEPFGVDEIFLTHHHPDHREYADEIARYFRVPMGMSADTRERISKRSARFFEGIETRIYGEGDVLTQWLGQPVNVLAVPGHDEGQLALMPEGREWCIVSDLFQGVGTVVVGGPEGNMRKYLASLQRVIDLDPAVVVPSHGMAQGTTWRIQETLRHRLMREEQVRTLSDTGNTPEEMVSKIYPGLDIRLLPLAMINVHSHLAKLREDGVLH